MAFLEDLMGSRVRWGPLLAFCYMQGCEFTTAAGGYLAPDMEEPLYEQMADDALRGLSMWLPRLGVDRTRPGVWPGSGWGFLLEAQQRWHWLRDGWP